jgi:hypothetical protein
MKRLLVGLVMMCGVGAWGQSLPLDPAMGITTIPVYSTPLPGVPAEEQPTLTVFVPQQGHGTGSAIVIAPGGAYLGLASNLEGRQVADWFAARGVTAFVLKYRLGAKYLHRSRMRKERFGWCGRRRRGMGIRRTRSGSLGFRRAGIWRVRWRRCMTCRRRRVGMLSTI